MAWLWGGGGSPEGSVLQRIVRALRLRRKVQHGDRHAPWADTKKDKGEDA